MKIKCVCCFCGRDIKHKKGGIDPLSLAAFAATEADTEQTFWAHIKCFRARLYDKSILRENWAAPKSILTDLKEFDKFTPNETDLKTPLSRTKNHG